MSEWTTRLPPELTRAYGREEIHLVYFEPDDAQRGLCLNLLIPECEFQAAWLVDGMPMAAINRPPTNKSVKKWMRLACREATTLRSPICFSCDTANEAERVAKLAARLLPQHRRAALERIPDAASRFRKDLN
jgi:hypothetical protein